MTIVRHIIICMVGSLKTIFTQFCDFHTKKLAKKLHIDQINTIFPKSKKSLGSTANTEKPRSLFSEINCRFIEEKLFSSRFVKSVSSSFKEQKSRFLRNTSNICPILLLIIRYLGYHQTSHTIITQLQKQEQQNH